MSQSLAQHDSMAPTIVEVMSTHRDENATMGNHDQPNLQKVGAKNPGGSVVE